MFTSLPLRVSTYGSLLRKSYRVDHGMLRFSARSEMLRDAQKNPEKYRDLIVRVAGYSDYFVDLNVELQDEIIKRTEHVSL